MQLQDLDVLKEIHGYTAILKAVLKSQIQMLVEQLSQQTGEESVILTASVKDCTLCQLGSSRGKNFLDGRKDLKTQFLQYCLNSENKEELPEATDIHTVRPIRNIQRIGPNPSSIAYSTSQTMNQASKQAKSLHHPSNISVSSPKSKVNTFTTLKSWTVASDFSNHPVDVISDETALFNDTNLDSSSTGSAIKVERNEDYDDDPVKLRQNVDVLSDNQMNCEHAKNAEQTLHPEVPSHDLAEGTETVVHENEPKTFDISSVKLEPGTKDDLDIEITCVQKDNSGMDMSDGNWTSSVSYGSSSEHQFQVVNDMLMDDSNPVLYTSSEHHDDDSLSETSIVKKRPKIKRGLPIKSLHLKPESSPWKCHYCGRVFKRMNGLEDHINVIHLKKAKFVCKICNKVFKRKPTFHDHLNTHSKITPYKCENCGKAYGSQGAYRRHVRTSECTMKGQFKCDRCEFKCNRADYLKEHVKGVHDGHKYSCNKCGNSFNWRVTLSRHKKTCTGVNQHPRKQILRPKLDYFEANHHNIKSKTTHAGLEMSLFKNNKILLKAKGKTAKPHVCGFCLKPFRQRYHLIQHQRLHTGERPFQCSTCSRAYTSKNKLRDHCRTFGHQSEHFDMTAQVTN